MSTSTLNSLEGGVMQICVAFLLKWILGSDDLVWLAPFMARVTWARKVKVCYKYVLSVLLLMGVVASGSLAIQKVGSSGERLADDIIGTTAAVLLLGYSLHMAKDEGYFDSRIDVDGDDKTQEAGLASRA